MKPRDFLNFFKTKSGKLAAFAVLFTAALIIFCALRKQHQSPDDLVSVTALATNVTDRPQVVESVVRPLQAFYPPPPKPEPTNVPSSTSLSASPASVKPTPLPVVPANQTLTLTPISLFAVVRKGFHPKLGARPMRDAVEKLVGDALAVNLLAGQNHGGRLQVDESRDCLIVR